MNNSTRPTPASVRAVYAAVAVALSPRTASMTAGVCQGVGVGAEAWR
jgi:hypothetical protein